jgi:hypothetical protein
VKSFWNEDFKAIVSDRHHHRRTTRVLGSLGQNGTGGQVCEHGAFFRLYPHAIILDRPVAEHENDDRKSKPIRELS